jgi:hypothetical protein
MSKLKKLYQTLNSLQELGLKINNDLLDEINRLESDFINNEIKTLLTETIEPKLSQLERDVTFVIKYKPNFPLIITVPQHHNSSVEHQTINQRTNETVTLKINTNENGAIKFGEQKTSSNNYSKISMHRSGVKTLRVKFPDGVIISENTAADTLVKTIQKIGVEKVRRFITTHSIYCDGSPIITKERDSRYQKAFRDLGQGWFINTHSSGSFKKNFLDKLSNGLNLGLRVSLSD